MVDKKTEQLDTIGRFDGIKAYVKMGSNLYILLSG